MFIFRQWSFFFRNSGRVFRTSREMLVYSYFLEPIIYVGFGDQRGFYCFTDASINACTEYYQSVRSVRMNVETSLQKLLPCIVEVQYVLPYSFSARFSFR